MLVQIGFAGFLKRFGPISQAVCSTTKIFLDKFSALTRCSGTPSHICNAVKKVVFAVLETPKFMAGKGMKFGVSRGEVIVVVAFNFLPSVPLGTFIVSGKLFIDILIRDWLQWSCKIQDGV